MGPVQRVRRRRPIRTRSCFGRPTCTPDRSRTRCSPSAGPVRGRTTSRWRRCRPAASRCSTRPARTRTRSRSWCWPGMLLAARNIDRALPYVTAQSAGRPGAGGTDRGRQEGVRRLRAGRPHPRRGRARQDRLPGRRRGDQARHGRDRLRPGDHRRVGVEPAGHGPEGARAWARCCRHSNFLTLHVPLVDATRAMIDAGGPVPAEAGRGAAQLLPRRGGRRGGGAGGAGGGSAVHVRLRLSLPRSWSAGPGWSCCRISGPRPGRPRRTAR